MSSRRSMPAVAPPSRRTSGVVLVLFAVYLALSAYVAWRSILLQPCSDMFDWLAHYYRILGPQDVPRYLWAPHNFHRIAWTFAILGIDMSVFDGAGWPFVITSTACLGLTAWLLAREAWRAGKTLRLPTALVAAMLTLMSVNLMSVGLYIQANYLHAALLAVAAIVVAEPLGEGPPGLARRSAALALAAAAAFGNAVGLALWPVLAFAALRQGRLRWLAAVVIVGAAFVSLYALGQSPAAVVSVRRSGDLAASGLLLLSYLGLPWTAVAPDAGWLLGSVLLAFSVAALVLKGGKGAPRSERVAVQLILFSLGTAMMAALGRTGLTTPEHLSVRYAVLLAPLHVGLLILVTPWLEAARRAWPRIVGTAVVGFVLVLLAQQAASGLAVIRAQDVRRLVIDDFRHGLRSPAMTEIVYPRLDYAAALEARLMREGRYQHELHLPAARRATHPGPLPDPAAHSFLKANGRLAR